MANSFRDYNLEQPMLLPPDMRDWVAEDHLSLFISDVVDAMDMSAIKARYQGKNGTGPKAMDPRMMLKLLTYGYCIGVRSSRQLEKATHDIVPFRVLTGDQHPDHDTIAKFRRRHLADLGDLFLQVLQIAQRAGMVKMGHVSLDGTKIEANANKSKSRTHAQLKKSAKELEIEIAALLKQAEHCDQQEDRLFGKGRRGDELPKRLRKSKQRRDLIKNLIENIEQEAKETAKKIAQEKTTKRQEDEQWREQTGQKIEGRYPQTPGVGVKPAMTTARRNPTDYDSRIMKEHQSGGFVQAYNCQICVDGDSQIIVAAEVTNQTSDKQLAPQMVEQAVKNTGRTPMFLTADNGYFSERDIVKLEALGIDPYIPPTRNSNGKRLIKTGCRKVTLTKFMREKLSTKTGKKIYGLRKTITEPVFGQIKQTQGMRQFLLRGIDKVEGEWQLAAMCHNIKKLHRHKLRN